MAKNSIPKTCWICGKAIKLDCCAVDERGRAVHEECYVSKAPVRHPRRGAKMFNCPHCHAAVSIPDAPRLIEMLRSFCGDCQNEFIIIDNLTLTAPQYLRAKTVQ